MRSHAKAPSAGTIQVSAIRRGMLGIACVLSLMAFLGGAAPLAWGAAPTVTIGATSAVTDSSAQVSGSVDPAEHSTTYRFEYATQADFSNGRSAGVRGPLAGGAGQTAVEQTLTGLLPSTTYHLRLVATNVDGETEAVAIGAFSTLADPCPNAAIRALQGSTSLPNCRAFEKISPNDKNGGDIRPANIVGNRIFGAATASFLPDDVFYDDNARFSAIRQPGSGWALRPLSVAARTVVTDVSETTDREIIAQVCFLCVSLLPADTDTGPDLYARDQSGLRLISVGTEGGNSGEASIYVGQSRDGSHILFETTEHLEAEDPAAGPGARTSGNQLYDSVGGQTHVVGILPDERCSELSLPAGCVDPGGASLGNGQAAGSAGSSNAVSSDGSVAFFESPDPAAGGIPQLYARLGGTETVLVSASQCQRVSPVCDDDGHGAVFQGAAEDGSRVYFTSAGQLVDADIDAVQDLYQYNFTTDDLRLISQDCVGPDRVTQFDCSLDGAGPDRDAGVISVSADGRTVYFLGPPTLSAEDESKHSIWVHSETDGVTRFVAPGYGGNNQNYFVSQGLTNAPKGGVMTPDGTSFVFQSLHRLTAYDNARNEQLYRYRLATDSVDCISCNPLGDPPTGVSNFAFVLFKAGGALSGVASAAHGNTMISDDGRNIVFTATDALLPEDTNGPCTSPSTSCEDVYLWHDGALTLLTSGVETHHPDPPLAGISHDGSDIIISTFEQLVPADTDAQADLYDARVNGGLAADHPSVQSGGCAGDACRQGSAQSPAVTAPTSNTFVGPGNQSTKHKKAKPKRKKKRSHQRRGKRSQKTNHRGSQGRRAHR